MIAALSVPEHCLSFYFVCDDQIQISCAVGLRKMENLAATFCYLWLTEKLWLQGGCTPPPPYKTIITLLPVTFSQLDPQLGVGWGKRLVLWYLMTNGLKLFNCQIFSRLAFGIKGSSSKTHFISSIIRLLCPALWHYVCEHIIYTVYSDCVLVFAFAFLSCKKKKICFKQDFLHWIIQKLAKICQDFKEEGIIFKE